MELYLDDLKERRTMINLCSTITELTGNLTYLLGPLNIGWYGIISLPGRCKWRQQPEGIGLKNLNIDISNYSWPCHAVDFIDFWISKGVSQFECAALSSSRECSLLSK